MSLTNPTRDELGLIARYDVGRSLVDLEPSAIIELYELYFNVNELPFRFHAGTNNLTKDIVWNGDSYYASAIEVEGFEANIMGRLPRPKVTVANSDYIISSILRDYSDFRNGKFVRIKLFLKHLDSVNFDGKENPFGTPDPLAYISKEKYLVSQKIIENKQIVQFELITPFDLQSLETATRAIYGRYCYWQYRGMGCNYQGDVICQENDKDFSVPPNRSKSPSGQYIKNEAGAYKNKTFSETIKEFKWSINVNYLAGDIVYVENIDFNGYKDPPRTFFVCIKGHLSTKYINPNKSVDYWEKDGCSKTITSCKRRFRIPSYQGAGYVSYNDSDAINGVMPFGGFPGTDKFRYE
jgi:lambda family phage minor tail protein L